MPADDERAFFPAFSVIEQRLPTNNCVRVCVRVCVYLNTARKEIYVDTMSDHTRPTSTCSRLFLNLCKDTDILWLLLAFTA